MWGQIFQSGQVMWVKQSDASGRLSSALPGGEKLLKYLPTEAEEVILAPTEHQVLPEELSTTHLFGNKIDSISKTLFWRFLELNSEM